MNGKVYTSWTLGFLAGVFALTLLFSCQQQQKTIPAELTEITTGLVGPIFVDSDMSDIDLSPLGWSMSGQYRSSGRDVLEPVALVMDEDEKVLMELMWVFDDEAQSFTDEIGAIAVVSPIFKTEYGVHTGMTLRAILDKGLEAKPYYSSISETFWLRLSNHDGINFIIEPEAYTGDTHQIGKENIDLLEIGDFAPNGKITKILVY